METPGKGKAKGSTVGGGWSSSGGTREQGQDWKVVTNDRPTSYPPVGTREGVGGVYCEGPKVVEMGRRRRNGHPLRN